MAKKKQTEKKVEIKQKAGSDVEARLAKRMREQAEEAGVGEGRVEDSEIPFPDHPITMKFKLLSRATPKKNKPTTMSEIEIPGRKG